MDEFKPYRIQQAVVTSLKEEFEKAVDKARAKALAEAEKTLMTGEPPYNSGYRSGFDLLSARRAIKSLQQSALGDYSLCYRFSTVTSMSNGYQLWGQYLQSIGRLDNYAFGCVPRNEKTIRALVRQNGPKKMEARLRSFARKRRESAPVQGSAPPAPAE